MPPPPGMYPPPMMMPPPGYYPPPPHRGGFARAIVTTMATSIFGLSIALNIYLLLFSGVMSGGGGTTENVLQPGDTAQTIAVVSVTGMIDGEAAMRFDKQLRTLEKDKDIKALVLEVDTPGGTVTGSDEVYHRILQYKKKTGNKVVVSMGAMATSGGYYISCAADEILAERTTLTGNIGVLMERFNLTKLAEKWGVEETTLHSTGSDFKTVGSMFREETPEETAYLLGLVNDFYATFKQVVKDGRGAKLTAPMETIANGKVYTAAEAEKMGLIDGLGYKPDAYASAATLAGLSKPHVVRYEQIPSLMSLFGASSSLGGASKAVNINGVNLNIDGKLLDQFATPRAMYLWKGQ
jgi:protease-4